MYTSGMSTVIAISKSPADMAVLVLQFKALGDPTRLELIMNVARSAAEEACVCDLTPDTGLTQGTVSHHLRILVEAGLLERTQRGKWSYYCLTSSATELLKSLNLSIPTGARKEASC
jgi:ArsR family transcriptional regulator